MDIVIKTNVRDYDVSIAFIEHSQLNFVPLSFHVSVFVLYGILKDCVCDVRRRRVMSKVEWDNAFEGSQNELGRLSEEALQEYRADKTEPLDPDRI